MFLQGEEGAAHQDEQEVTLHQQPAVVGEDGVVGKHQRDFTPNLPCEFIKKKMDKVRFSTGKSGGVASWEASKFIEVPPLETHLLAPLV